MFVYWVPAKTPMDSFLSFQSMPAFLRWTRGDEEVRLVRAYTWFSSVMDLCIDTVLALFFL